MGGSTATNRVHSQKTKTGKIRAALRIVIMASTAKLGTEDTCNRHAADVSGSHKRKAAVCDAKTNPPPKRHRVGDMQRDRCNAFMQTSLDALIRAESKSRLYVHPIAWTGRHLQLLGVSFDSVKKLGCHCMDDQTGPDTRGVTKLTVSPWGGESSLRATENLSAMNVGLQRLAMADLLRSYGLRTEYAIRKDNSKLKS